MTIEKTLALVRPHLRNLQPYSSARDEFDQSQIAGEKFVYLDANENPFETGYNRYPDPYQRELKKVISGMKGVRTDSVFIGNGSDEAIDLIIRLFCNENENIVISSPTYGMYKVSAEVNNVKVKTSLLDENFQLTGSFLSQADKNTKVIFLCSPNNPSGNLLDVLPVVRNFRGVVVVDEAYIDFTGSASLTGSLELYPNLIVLQTLSKAWGLAGLRLGMAFASPEIISLLNKIKPPYNISESTQRLGLQALARVDQKDKWVQEILNARTSLAARLSTLTSVKKVFPSATNFLLVRIDNATEVYQRLIKDGIVVRDRSRVSQCEDCLRITVGTSQENEKLLNALKSYE